MRKGIEWDLNNIILLLVLFIILFFIAKGMISIFIGSGSSQTCLLSVIAASRTRGSVPVELECSTNFVGKMSSRGRNDAEKKDYTMRWISDLGYECWMQFGEGHYDVFQGKFIDKATHCFICSKFSVDNEIKGNDLLDFIKESHISKTKESYYSYLQKGLLWEVDDSSGSYTRADTPVLLVEELDFSKLEDAGIWDKIMAYTTTSASFDFTTIVDYWFTKTSVKKMDKLEPNEDYAIIYFQISDAYWQQSVITRVISWIAEKVGIKDEDDSVPPARIFITKYENIERLNCDMLQG